MLIVGCSATEGLHTKTAFKSSYQSVENSQKLSLPCQHTTTAFNCVKVLSVYDGDTIFIDMPEYHPLFGKRIGVRVFGIDAPELRSKNACEKVKGKEARSVLEAILHNAKRVDIIDVQRDKFFRILGTIIADGKSVADELIKRRLAYSYHGEDKIKINWCR